MSAFLYGVVIALHVLVCLVLVAVVLLQSGKGADIGAAFGGSSQTVFGSRGPTTFFHYVTGSAAGLFLLTTVFLSCSPSPSSQKGSVLPDDTPAPVESPAAATGTGAAMGVTTSTGS